MQKGPALPHGQLTAATDMVVFIALLATALATAAAVAHVLELPNKITLAREEYFTVQGIYRGWSLLGILLAVELAAMVVLSVRMRRSRRALTATVVAIGCLVAAQVIFWIWTYPANTATENWTTVPENWQTLRVQWEYSHLAGAVFQVLALCALIVAALMRGRDGE